MPLGFSTAKHYKSTCAIPSTRIADNLINIVTMSKVSGTSRGPILASWEPLSSDSSAAHRKTRAPAPQTLPLWKSPSQPQAQRNMKEFHPGAGKAGQKSFAKVQTEASSCRINRNRERATNLQVLALPSTLRAHVPFSPLESQIMWKSLLQCLNLCHI